MSRERTADSAWFLIRFQGIWCGLSPEQVRRFLKHTPGEVIRDHACALQLSLATGSADRVREILVGDIINNTQG